MSIRALTSFEKLFFTPQEMVQGAMRVAEKGIIPTMKENILKSSPVFWLKSDGEKLYATDEKPICCELPDSIIDPKDACEYIHRHYRVDPSTRLGVVANNENVIAFMGHHAIMDGKHALKVIQESVNGPSEKIPPLPESNDSVVLPNLPQCKPEDWETFKAESQKLTTFSVKSPEKDAGPYSWCDYSATLFRASDFKCYDPKRGKLSDFNSHMFAAIVLSTTANNGSFGNFGVETCINLRYFVPGGSKICGNIFAESLIVAHDTSPKQTLGSLVKQMRAGLERIKDPRTAAAYVAAMTGTGPAACEGPTVDFGVSSSSGLVCETSCIGHIEAPKPITDVWIQQTMRAVIPQTILPVISWTKNVDGELKALTRVQIPLTAISRAEAMKFHAGLNYVLTDITDDVPLDVAVEAVRDYIKKM